MAGHTRSVAAGALDPDDRWCAERLDPCLEFPVAGRRGREATIAEFSADVIDHRSHVDLGVGVDPDRDRVAVRDWVCDDAHVVLPFRDGCQDGTHEPERDRTRQ